MKSVLDAWRANVVLDLDFRTGSLKDLSGKDNHPDTVAGVHWTQARNQRALMFPAGNDVTVPDDATLRLASALTIVWFGAFDDMRNLTNPRICVKFAVALTPNYEFYYNQGNGRLYLGSGVLDSNILFDPSRSRSIAVTLTSGSAPRFFKGGGLAGTGAALTLASATGPGELVVGNYIAGSIYVPKNPAHRLVILDTALPDADILRLYQEVVG